MVDKDKLKAAFFAHRVNAEANITRTLETIYEDVLALITRDDVKTVADLRPEHLGRKVAVQTPAEMRLSGHLVALSFEEVTSDETNVSLMFKGDIAPHRVAQTWLCVVEPTDEELRAQYEKLAQEPVEEEDPLVFAARERVRAAIRTASQAVRDVVDEASVPSDESKTSLKADIASAVSQVVSQHSKDRAVSTAQQARRFASVGASAVARAAKERLDKIDKPEDRS